MLSNSVRYHTSQDVIIYCIFIPRSWIFSQNCTIFQFSTSLQRKLRSFSDKGGTCFNLKKILVASFEKIKEREDWIKLCVVARGMLPLKGLNYANLAWLLQMCVKGLCKWWPMFFRYLCLMQSNHRKISIFSQLNTIIKFILTKKNPNTLNLEIHYSCKICIDDGIKSVTRVRTLFPRRIKVSVGTIHCTILKGLYGEEVYCKSDTTNC